MPVRKFLRSLVYSAVALFLTSQIIPGFEIAPGLFNLLIVTLVLTLLNWLVRPLVKLLLLPINLVTLGAFRWLTTIVILYLLTWVIPEVNIFSFPLHTIPVIGIVLPQIFVGKFIATLLTTLSFTTIRRLIVWLTKG